MRLDQLIKIRLETQKINKPKEFEPLEKGEDDPCWEGYVQLGTKLVDGKEVPNCVPIKEEQSKEKFVIPTPDGGESEQDYIGRCISAIGKEYDVEGQAYAVCKGKYDE
jgi:hypothetical protein